MADFPVPVGPTNKVGTSCVRRASRKYFWRAVSCVEMISSEGWWDKHKTSTSGGASKNNSTNKQQNTNQLCFKCCLTTSKLWLLASRYVVCSSVSIRSPCTHNKNESRSSRSSQAMAPSPANYKQLLHGKISEKVITQIIDLHPASLRTWNWYWGWCQL